MEEADHAGGEGQGDPGEIGQEQDQQRPFERADAADVDDAVHLVAAPGGERESAAEGDEARQPGRREAPDRLAPFASPRSKRDSFCSGMASGDSAGIGGRECREPAAESVVSVQS